MYQALSISQPDQAYVFDEFKLHEAAIGNHPRLDHHGKVVETTEAPLVTPVTDRGLIDILNDCKELKIFVGIGYDSAVAYLRSILSKQELEKNKYMVNIHTLQIS